MKLLPPPTHAPVDFLTAEPGTLTDDEAVAALLAVLERVQAATLPSGTADDEQEHVVRCCGCGGWAWDDRPCPTCACARRHTRQKAS